MNGVLILNKPRGMTSHDCVMKLRRLLATKKIGHAGTLDPDVDGVLVVCIGRATKLVPFLTADSKRYVGEVTLGMSTTTEDASGDILEEKEVLRLTVDEVDAVLASMLGEHLQQPPMFSAVKINGKRLYEYARAGIAVERPKRKIHIHSLERLTPIKHIAGRALLTFDIHGSKGIFIRTVAVTIGEHLGYPAHMSQLTRVASWQFVLADAVTFEQIEAGDYKLLSIEAVLAHFPSVEVNDWLASLVKNGVQLREDQIMALKKAPFLVKHGTEALAIYEWHEEKQGYTCLRGI